MEFLGIKKTDEGRFICRYDVEYRTALGNIKTYEMISRNKEMNSLEDLRKVGTVDAVILIVHSPDNSKILLNKEFRMAVGKEVYNFPAGLVDPGETIEVSAKRELWEETGLNLTSVQEIWPACYSAVGVTNETSACVIGVAEGEFKPSTSDEEEIEAGWFTKEQVLDLLKTEPFAARTQSYCYLWARS
ncbi:MAG: NUDIX hydrolase [Clostridiales bacterium]|nr:NUDIX hydrolase [Clostridiales bacterium]